MKAIASAGAVAAITLGLSLLTPNVGATGSFSTAARGAPDPHPHRVTQLSSIRVGNDGNFDRIVFDEKTSQSGYSVRYVRQLVADPSGAQIRLKGQYVLRVVVPDSFSSGIPAVMTPGLPEVAQIKKAGEFERVVSYGIGLNHYRGFRILRLTSPARLVVDVLH